MARASMVDLIGRVRRLINDGGAGGAIFTDDEIQEALDRHQTVVRYAPLRLGPTVRQGLVEYLDYYADVGDWEADAVLYDAAGNPLTPAHADYLTGHWVFNNSVQPPVLIVGKFYDVYGAAADLLEAWAAKAKLEFDFSSDGQSFQRSQKVDALLRLAREYRRRQRPAVVLWARPDLGGW